MGVGGALTDCHNHENKGRGRGEEGQHGDSTEVKTLHFHVPDPS